MVESVPTIDLGANGEKVIDVLCELECASVKRIVQETGLPYGTAYKEVRKLEAKQYVKRCPNCRDVYRITTAGRKAAITPNPNVWLDEPEE